MRNIRLALLVSSLLTSAALAVAARETVYSLVVVPVAYLAWEIGIIYRAVPQLVWWVALIVVTVLVLAWQLVPEVGSGRGDTRRAVPARGQVYMIAHWLRRARTSAYFKWQLANRLGRTSQRIGELGGDSPQLAAASRTVAGFLEAGLRNSFMDYSSRRGLFRKVDATPLDTDLSEVVTFLEAQVLIGQGDHAKRG